MRPRLVLVAIAAASTLFGCGVPLREYQARVNELRLLEAERRAQDARMRSMEARLNDALADLAELQVEKAQTEQHRAALEEALAQSEAAEKELRELNQHLLERQREYVKVTEQAESAWHTSSLDRARRSLWLEDGARAPAPLRPVGPD